VAAPGAEGLAEGAEVELVVRPEALALRREEEGGDKEEELGGVTEGLLGRVVERRYAGPISYYAVRLDAGPEVEVLAAESAGEPLAAEGDRVRVSLSGRGPAPRIFTAAEPATGAVRDGDPASPQSPSEAAGPAVPGGDG
jgi:ABC-type Fe3+/spermidine/putrescine transport system ATPase subunit